MSYCINCGNKLEDGYEFCPECGVKVDQVLGVNTGYHNIIYKRCSSCGAEMPEDAFYCLNCGKTFDDYYDFDRVQNQVKYAYLKNGIWKNKWTALLLCIFLGWMGAHKYYEGRIGLGILYTFTLGLFLIGWAVDVAILIFKPNPYRVK